MADTNSYLHKQGAKPLFPDLLWSKPQNKRTAGKLLIIGGNTHEFTAPANAYSAAGKAGIGSTKVLLPNSLAKLIGQVLENTEFAESTKSGGFGKKSLNEWLDLAAWGEGVLMAGDLGRNSETAVVIEQFITRYTNELVITQDAVEYFNNIPLKLLERPKTTIVASVAQAQKLVMNARFPQAIKFDMTLLQIAEVLHELTTMYPARWVIKHNNIYFVAADGDISTTKTDNDFNIWRVETAATCAVWLIHNPDQPFQALTTSIHELVSN